MNNQLSFQNGEDIVISSRIRIARNLTTFPYEQKMNAEQKKELGEQVKAVLQQINLGENAFTYSVMQELDNNERGSFVERHIVSKQFANVAEGMLALSKDHKISIMVNEEDHIRIQVIEPGLTLSEAFQTANMIDDVLDASLDYAFHDRFGYLTTCMTNLGTGVRASVMLHLPALEKAGALNSILNTISKLGLTIRGTFGEGSDAYGAIYQVSNQITLGISEEQAIENLKNVVQQLIENEKKAREKIYANPVDFEDLVCRSYGILTNARKLPTKEFYSLISNIRLGISAGVLPQITLETIDRLEAKIGPATIQCQSKELLTPEQRDTARADYVRQQLAITK